MCAIRQVAYHYLQKKAMQQPQPLVPVQSLVPVTSLKIPETIDRKRWHIICGAIYHIPVGLQIMTVRLFMVYFDGRVFLSLFFETSSMLPPSQDDLEFEEPICLMNHPASDAIPLPCGAIPLGYGVFEMPDPYIFLNEEWEHQGDQ